MTNYTVGNWTVSDQYTDTVATTKNVAVPDLSYSVDYKKTTVTEDEATISNITGADLSPHEVIRYGRSSVSNIYQGVDLVDSGSVAPVKRGVQVMAEITTVYHVVNSVTGEEYDLPTKGRVVLRVPSMSCVTDTLVNDLLKRTCSIALDTGSTTAARVVELARGSILPAGL